MRPLSFFPARYTVVVGMLVLITGIIMFSDVMAAPGLTRDLIRAIGGQLAALGGSVWYRRCRSRISAKVCITFEVRCEVLARRRGVVFAGGSSLFLG